MKKNIKGFTLVEILVVMTILIALTLFGVTKYMNIVEDNKQKIDIANARNMAEAVSIKIAMGDSFDDDSNITTSHLNELIDGKMKPMSKMYSEGDATFVAKIVNKEVKIYAGSQIVFPN